jgi:hypothetical protein
MFVFVLPVDLADHLFLFEDEEDDEEDHATAAIKTAK